jgi:hypothetical protein
MAGSTSGWGSTSGSGPSAARGTVPEPDSSIRGRRRAAAQPCPGTPRTDPARRCHPIRRRRRVARVDPAGQDRSERGTAGRFEDLLHPLRGEPHPGQDRGIVEQDGRRDSPHIASVHAPANGLRPSATLRGYRHDLALLEAGDTALDSVGSTP